MRNLRELWCAYEKQVGVDRSFSNGSKNGISILHPPTKYPEFLIHAVRSNAEAAADAAYQVHLGNLARIAQGRRAAQAARGKGKGASATVAAAQQADVAAWEGFLPLLLLLR